jgi:hypothetical protein
MRRPAHSFAVLTRRRDLAYRCHHLMCCRLLNHVTAGNMVALCAFVGIIR